MSRTNIDVDADLVATAMYLYSLPSKREAVDLALRKPIGDLSTV